MRFPYYQLPPLPDYAKAFPHKPKIYQPLITVVLRYQGRKHKVLALIDSGADACLFPQDVADILGINVATGPRADLTGIGGGRFPFYFHDVALLFDRYQVNIRAGFARGKIGISGLLGQKGFFDQFVVTFDHPRGFVEVRPPNLLDRITARFAP